MATCTHLNTVRHELPEHIEGCEECLKIGASWVHLRECRECGKVGCCDDSPNRHATAHFHETNHPIVRSAEPGEEWSWGYLDEVGFIANFPEGGKGPGPPRGGARDVLPRSFEKPHLHRRRDRRVARPS